MTKRRDSWQCSDKYQPLFAFAIDTGARPSEVLALKWSDLDLDRSTVTIQRTLQRHKGKGKGWYFSEPKTSKSRRNVPLTPGIVRELKDYRVRRGEELLSWGIRSDLVFCSDSGTPLVLENLTKRHFKPILNAAMIPTTATLYSLRHSCATLLLAAGVHPKIVAERLGHSSVTITMDVYSHVLPGMQEEATAQLERMLYG